jgi:gamma-glutamylputrescine oxidase
MASDDERSSYYYARAGAGAARPPLAGSSATDVAIVGGGIAGCAAALALAERGYRVTLLEAERIGAGASGRSGGQFLPGLAAHPERLAAWVGRAAARQLHALAREGLERAKHLMRAHGIAAEFAAGSLLVAVKSRQRAELLRERDLLAALGDEPPEFLERGALAERLASQRYVAGLYDGSAAHGDSLLYVRGLADAAERAGASICEGSRVLRLEMASPAVLHTAQGRLAAAHVLLAGNALLGPLAPTLARRIVPVRSFIVATEVLGPSRARALIPCDAAVADMNRVLDYFRLSRDHRLLFGGRAGIATYDRERFTHTTRARMLRVFPGLADVGIDYRWGCLVDLTLNRAPDFGRLRPHVYYVQGFCGHGLALATLSGELVAQAIAGQAERFDLFSRLPRQTLPRGAPLGALLRLGLLWYRLLDALP